MVCLATQVGRTRCRGVRDALSERLEGIDVAAAQHDGGEEASPGERPTAEFDAGCVGIAVKGVHKRRQILATWCAAWSGKSSNLAKFKT
jgi:hypothetical protein